MVYFRTLATLAVLASTLWATPATACYTGPVPLAFDSRTAQLTEQSKQRLAYYADMRGIDGKDRLLVIFYGPAPQYAPDKELLKKRQATVRGYMLYKGVPASAASIVATKRALPSYFRDFDPGVRPVATVELTIGCGG
jgi:hypothetical protein